MNTYVGRRDASTVSGAEHLDSGPYVLAVDSDGREVPLPELGDVQGYAMDLSGGFEWGYEGSGSINLAAAILKDALGFLPSAIVVLDFSESVVAGLSRYEFELTPDTLHAWIDVRLSHASSAARTSTGADF